MLYTNYEHKLPNKEKFREDGLLEALCQVLSEDRDKEKGEIVGSLKKENNGLKKKKVLKKFCSLMYDATYFLSKKILEESALSFSGGRRCSLKC